MKNLVIDVDKTLTLGDVKDYRLVKPNKNVVRKLKEYQSNGFKIILFSARNMRSYKNNIGEINANTLPILIEWLDKHKIPYDEIFMGKPWCGENGFYVDDKAIRPNEFVEKDYNEIMKIIS